MIHLDLKGRLGVSVYVKDVEFHGGIADLDSSTQIDSSI